MKLRRIFSSQKQIIRKFCVHFRKEVPQGSFLGPILFTFTKLGIFAAETTLRAVQDNLLLYSEEHKPF